MAPPPAGPAYQIHTPRLILRCHRPADAPLVKLSTDANLEHLRPWMILGPDQPQTLEQTAGLLRYLEQKFAGREELCYAIFDPPQTVYLGCVSLHIPSAAQPGTIGYWIHKDYLRQGLATEAGGALTRVAFQVEQAARIEMHCQPANLASIAVPRKLGFTCEGIPRDGALLPDGHYHDIMIWAMTAAQYPASPAAKIEIAALDRTGERIA